MLNQAELDDIRREAAELPTDNRAVGFVVARIDSSRLPSKAIMPICGYPVWWHDVQRVEAAARLTGLELVGLGVATSLEPHNDIIQQQCERYGYDCWRYSPEHDLPGRNLHVFEKTQTRFAVTLSGDSPLAYYSHWPALMPPYWSVGRIGTATFSKGRDPALDSVSATLCCVASAHRWQSRLNIALARTPDELEVGGLIVTRRPEESFDLLVPIPPACYVELPEEYWALHRWYTIELDWPEDAVTIRLIYDNLWRGPGYPVDCADVVRFIDEHGEWHYNSERKQSLVNQIVHGAEAERRQERYQLYLGQSGASG